jgi:hypothetical protein
MKRQGLTAFAAAAAVAALLVPAASAGAGPTAKASGEELVTYLTGGKLKVKKKIKYLILCGAPAGQLCEIEVSNKLKLKGPDLGPLRSSGIFAGGQAVEIVIQTNKGARKAIKAKLRAARLKSEITATNLTTGEVDFDSESFKLKKK